jgi:cellulose synthase/poly-beta-1,6-N-acetylglucosamine synthase-like glycosyltransferase
MITLFLIAISFIGVYISIWFLLLYLEKKEEFHKRSILKRFPKISVLIPAHNEEKIISETLDSLLRIDYPKDKLEIIVVDDGSSDRTYDLAKMFVKKGVKVYRKEWGGKAKALNYGLKKVRNNFVLTLDADCFLAKDALKKMVAQIQDRWTMAALPSIEVFNPKRILQNMQSVEYSFTSFFRKLTASVYALAVAPAAVLYKTEFFRKYGGFDEKTPTEDFEIGLRIVSHNFNIVHVYDSKVFTIVPNKLSGIMRQRVRWAYGSLSDLSKYRKLLSFNYGDLGAFILPQIPIYAGILISVLLLGGVTALQETLRYLHLFQLTNYDINVLLQLNPFYIFDIKTFTMFFLIFLALLNYFLVRKTKRNKISFFYFLLYTLLFSWLLAFFELVAIVHLLFRKKPRW